MAGAVEGVRIRAMEVRMRPPEVFVREFAPHEGPRLKQLSKSSKRAATRERALILLASNTLMSAPRIAHMLLTDESHVRKPVTGSRCNARVAGSRAQTPTTTPRRRGY